MMNEIIGLVLIIIGSLFYVLSSIGLIRMPDTFNRIQSSTIASTLGAFLVLLGVGIYEPHYLSRALLITAFIALTNPIGSSALARAAYLNGKEKTDGLVYLYEKEKTDGLVYLYGKEETDEPGYDEVDERNVG